MHLTQPPTPPSTSTNSLPSAIPCPPSLPRCAPLCAAAPPPAAAQGATVDPTLTHDGDDVNSETVETTDVFPTDDEHEYEQASVDTNEAEFFLGAEEGAYIGAEEEADVDAEEDADVDAEEGEYEEAIDQNDHHHPTHENQGATEVRYNLRSESFRAAVDAPFNSKSYYPPRQLLYKDIFGYIMAQLATDPEFGITMAQMSAKAGLKKYGHKAEEALMAEFEQLEGLEVYEPLDPTKLNRAQEKAALRAINLTKEKRCVCRSDGHRLQNTERHVRQNRNGVSDGRNRFTHGVHYRGRVQMKRCRNGRYGWCISESIHEGLHGHEVHRRLSWYSLQNEALLSCFCHHRERDQGTVCPTYQGNLWLRTIRAPLV